MAFPVIRYKSSTGSNTAASGAPFGMVAKTDVSEGPTISAIGAGNTITFSAAVDLTGVTDDGSDVIFVGHGLDERYLFAISAFNPSVAACTSVTTVQAIGATTLSGESWAIGGKRKDGQLQDHAAADGRSVRIESHDWDDGWTLEFENGETFVWPSVENFDLFAGTHADPITITASDPDSQGDLPMCSTSNNLGARASASQYGFFHSEAARCVVVRGLQFERLSGSWQGSWALQLLGPCLVEKNRIEGGAGLTGFFKSGYDGKVIQDNYIDLSGSSSSYFDYGINISESRSPCLIQRNVIILPSGCVGIHIMGSTFTGNCARNNVIVGGLSAIYANCATGFGLVSGNTCYNQSNNAIVVYNTSDGKMVCENLIAECGGYGVEIQSPSGAVFCDYNHFHNCTSGHYSNAMFGGLSTGPNDTVGDPGFVSTSFPYDLTPLNSPPLNAGAIGPVGS